jgi:hypothetical protein
LCSKEKKRPYAGDTLESRSDGGQAIGLAAIGSDSGGSQPLVGGEALEERHDGLEVDHGLQITGQSAVHMNREHINTSSPLV